MNNKIKNKQSSPLEKMFTVFFKQLLSQINMAEYLEHDNSDNRYKFRGIQLK